MTKGKVKYYKNLPRKILIRYTKPSVVKSVVPHTMISAGSGHGKDMFGEGLITQKVGKYKVIDFYSESREEGFFYSIPQDDKYFKELLAIRSKNKLHPRAFKSDIYMILGREILNKNTLPKNIKVVTLDENDFKGEEVFEFLSNGSNAVRDTLGLIEFVLEDVHKNAEPTLTDIQEEMLRILNDMRIEKKAERKYLNKNYTQLHPINIASICKNIINIRKSGMFDDAEKDGIKKISMEELIKDKDTITTFSLQLLKSDTEKALALGLLSKKIMNCKKKNPKLPKVLLYMREIQKFFEKRDDGIDKYYSMLKTSIYYGLTEGRDTGITIYGNAQDFYNQIPESFRIHFQKLYIGRQSKKSANALMEFANIPSHILSKIPELEIGTYMAIGSGKFHYPIFVPPTRHKKKQAGFNVMEYLTNKNGEYTWETKNLFQQSFRVSEETIDELKQSESIDDVQIPF